MIRTSIRPRKRSSKGPVTGPAEFIMVPSGGMLFLAVFTRILYGGGVLIFLASDDPELMWTAAVVAVAYVGFMTLGTARVFVTPTHLRVRNTYWERILDWSMIEQFEPGMDMIYARTVKGKVYGLSAVQRARITLWTKHESVVDQDSTWLNEYLAWVKASSTSSSAGLVRPGTGMRFVRLSVGEWINVLWPLVLGVVGGLVLHYR